MILAAAAAIFIALVSFVRRDPVRRVPIELSAFSLWQEASAAEAKLFAGDEVAHLVNEIVVTPVSDPTLARLRWFPLVSLEPTGKPRYDQLTLPAEVGKGYTVEDRSWYDPATGRFARTLTVGDRAISANSYDGKSVYTLEVPPTGASHLVKRPVAKDFRPPHSPAEFLGIAASLPNGLDLKDQTLVREVGKVTLADGAEGRVVKLGFPQGGPKGSDDAYYQFTIRTRDAAIEKMECIVREQVLLVIRRIKAEKGQAPSIGWDLAGIVKQVESVPAKPGPTVRQDMVVPNVSIEQMAKRADFSTYHFSKAPSWAAERQVTDILDIVSPPHRMFAISYRAADGRHVVLIQSYSYNKMLGPIVKISKLLYTSPAGVKAWSGPSDRWLAQILLTSARASIKDAPVKEPSGYLLETSKGTFPVLAINGKLSDQELHTLVNSLVPADPATK